MDSLDILLLLVVLTIGLMVFVAVALWRSLDEGVRQARGVSRPAGPKKRTTFFSPVVFAQGNSGCKVAKIITEERKRIGYFRESVNDVRFKARHVMDLMMHPSLTERAVYLIPMTGTSDGEAFELLKHISSEEIVQVLAKLEELFDKIPDHFGEISPELDHLIWEKDQFLEENSQIIMLTAPLHVQLGKNIDRLQDELGVYAVERRKAILALRSTIENDIRTLSVRIQNLRYEYAKIPV
ncbi:hypothetical protein Fcan01_15340 [Folsomia candida]|uniref:Uncharacterized protein n=1 Tax=Folsomia candida TaxID=158441 RepID=A0A226DW98_FOLCA|nr:hypothetical protein Fcan01_15340 [Folsomia candida]